MKSNSYIKQTNFKRDTKLNRVEVYLQVTQEDNKISPYKLRCKYLSVELEYKKREISYRTASGDCKRREKVPY